MLSSKHSFSLHKPDTIRVSSLQIFFFFEQLREKIAFQSWTDYQSSPVTLGDMIKQKLKSNPNKVITFLQVTFRSQSVLASTSF